MGPESLDAGKRSAWQPRSARSKVVGLDQLLVRPLGSLVFTNGCFDWLHVGHLKTLEAARALGDVLVVGVNSDASVRRLKGPQRPMVPQDQRALMVAALECVDFVVIFDDLTAERLVLALRPAWYVKGGDYRVDQLPEAAAARAVGSRILLVPPEPGLSTTALVAKARGSAGT